MRETSEGPGDDPRDVARQIETVGSLVVAGRAADALSIAEPMLARLDPARDRRSRLEVLSWLGPAYAYLGRIDDCYAAAGELIDLAGDEPSSEVASALCLRGVARVHLGAENEGLADLRAAAQVAQRPELDRQELFGTLAVLASSSRNIGLYESAEYFCGWGESLAEYGKPVAIAYHAETWAWLHAEWAVTLHQEGDLPGARRHMNRTDELAARMHHAAALVPGPGRDILSVDAEALRAFVAAWEGRAGDALAILDTIPAEPAPRPEHNPALAVLLARTITSRTLGDTHGAMELARLAGEMATLARAERWQAESFRLRRDMARDTGDTGRAAAAGERFEALLDSMSWRRRLRPLQLAGPG